MQSCNSDTIYLVFATTELHSELTLLYDYSVFPIIPSKDYALEGTLRFAIHNHMRLYLHNYCTMIQFGSNKLHKLCCHCSKLPNINWNRNRHTYRFLPRHSSFLSNSKLFQVCLNLFSSFYKDIKLLSAKAERFIIG